MTLDTLIIFAGAFVAALPFLGFPSSWDTVLLLLAGVLIIGLGVTLRRGVGEKQDQRNVYTHGNSEQGGGHDTL